MIAEVPYDKHIPMEKPNERVFPMSLSERIRVGSEAAQWVVDEVLVLERELADAYLEMRKIRITVKAIFDRDVWDRAEKLPVDRPLTK